MDYRQTSKDVFHLAILVALVASLLFILTWTGVMRCGAIPGWCDAYYYMVRGGPPRLLIVEGLGGMGDPELLQQTLANPEYAGVRAQIQRLDLVNLENLKKYDLVIVERARQMSTGKLNMFMEYYTNGGRIVWTGDAGTELAPGDELLLANEDPNLDTNSPVAVNPWRRKEAGKVIAFDEFLSVGFVSTFCQVKECSTTRPWQGLLRTDVSRDHALVRGLRQFLPLRGDFAIVHSLDSVGSTRVMTLDWESNLIANDGVDYGRAFPMIQTRGVGERVAYYAVPPEQFVAPDLPEKYFSIVENMYFGMIK